jgi:restriction endonuclease S subunit
VVESGQPVVASSSVYILRLRGCEVAAEYLALYLNSLQAQADFLRLSTSGSIRSLLKSHLVDLEIPIPSVTQQNELVSLCLNIEKQKQLLERKIYLVNSIFDGTLMRQLVA